MARKSASRRKNVPSALNINIPPANHSPRHEKLATSFVNASSLAEAEENTPMCSKLLDQDNNSLTHKGDEENSTNVLNVKEVKEDCMDVSGECLEGRTEEGDPPWSPPTLCPPEEPQLQDDTTALNTLSALQPTTKIAHNDNPITNTADSLQATHEQEYVLTRVEDDGDMLVESQPLRQSDQSSGQNVDSYPAEAAHQPQASNKQLLDDSFCKENEYDRQIDLSSLERAELDGLLPGENEEHANVLSQRYDALRKSHKTMRENYFATQKNIDNLKRQVGTLSHSKKMLEAQVSQLTFDVQRHEQEKNVMNVACLKFKLSLLTAQNEFSTLTQSHQSLIREKEELQTALTEASVQIHTLSNELRKVKTTPEIKPLSSHNEKPIHLVKSPNQDSLQTSKLELMKNLQKLEEAESQQQQQHQEQQEQEQQHNIHMHELPSISFQLEEGDTGKEELLNDLADATREMTNLKLENARCKEKLRVIQLENNEKLKEQSSSFKGKLQSLHLEYEEKLMQERQAREALKHNAEQVWRQLISIQESQKTSGMAAHLVRTELKNLREVIQQKDQLIHHQSKTMRFLEEKTSEVERAAHLEQERTLSAKENELQTEMEQLMTQQSEQIKRFMQAIQTKEETDVLEGFLEKKVKGMVDRWHRRYCKLTTKRLMYWRTEEMNGLCRMIELIHVREIHVHRSDSDGKPEPGDCSFEIQTRDRSFFFQAGSLAEFRKWHTSLIHAMQTTEYALKHANP